MQFVQRFAAIVQNPDGRARNEHAVQELLVLNCMGHLASEIVSNEIVLYAL